MAPWVHGGRDVNAEIVRGRGSVAKWKEMGSLQIIQNIQNSDVGRQKQRVAVKMHYIGYSKQNAADGYTAAGTRRQWRRTATDSIGWILWVNCFQGGQ